jgi:hypothetical protein
MPVEPRSITRLGRPAQVVQPPRQVIWTQADRSAQMIKGRLVPADVELALRATRLGTSADGSIDAYPGLHH